MAFDTSGIRLKPCVDLFSTEASRQDASLEKIREIPLDQLVPFKDHARYGEGMALLFPGGQHARRRKPPYAQGA